MNPNFDHSNLHLPGDHPDYSSQYGSLPTMPPNPNIDGMDGRQNRVATQQCYNGISQRDPDVLYQSNISRRDGNRYEPPNPYSSYPLQDYAFYEQYTAPNGGIYQPARSQSANERFGNPLPFHLTNMPSLNGNNSAMRYTAGNFTRRPIVPSQNTSYRSHCERYNPQPNMPPSSNFNIAIQNCINLRTLSANGSGINPNSSTSNYPNNGHHTNPYGVRQLKASQYTNANPALSVLGTMQDQSSSSQDTYPTPTTGRSLFSATQPPPNHRGKADCRAPNPTTPPGTPLLHKNTSHSNHLQSRAADMVLQLPVRGISQGQTANTQRSNTPLAQRRSIAGLNIRNRPGPYPLPNTQPNFDARAQRQQQPALHSLTTSSYRQNNASTSTYGRGSRSIAGPNKQNNSTAVSMSNSQPQGVSISNQGDYIGRAIDLTQENHHNQSASTNNHNLQRAVQLPDGQIFYFNDQDLRFLDEMQQSDTSFIPADLDEEEIQRLAAEVPSLDVDEFLAGKAPPDSDDPPARIPPLGAPFFHAGANSSGNRNNITVDSEANIPDIHNCPHPMAAKSHVNLDSVFLRQSSRNGSSNGSELAEVAVHTAPDFSPEDPTSGLYPIKGLEGIDDNQNL